MVDWIINKENTDEIKILRPYIKYDKILEFATRLSTDVYTLTNCLVELYVLSKLYQMIIYVNDDNYNVIYAFHPSKGIVYDYKENTKPFDVSKYANIKQIINLRFHYISKNIFPSRIEVMNQKKG